LETNTRDGADKPQTTKRNGQLIVSHISSFCVGQFTAGTLGIKDTAIITEILLYTLRENMHDQSIAESLKMGLTSA
jgi:hypothetical protein